ncbi:MAG: endonuclease/exonuclease/phosphatase family protein, partial [Acidiferrobacterales bacterium]|nr:endonuclease/exonuclease/phosphatase family protein [Acidiferrobacterales bacterium]
MRVATYNIENLDVTESGDQRNPTLQQRAASLKGMLNRIDADILCLQEVHGQETNNHTSDNPDRVLSALDFIIEETQYQNYRRAVSVTADDTPYDKRNLVVLSRFPVVQIAQYKHAFIEALAYKKVTASPPDDEAKSVTWERPIQHVTVAHPDLGEIHVINLHLKSRIPGNIPGQYDSDNYLWGTTSSWAEGYFLSSLRRVGQALETRHLIDTIFDSAADANILVCGDFNAEPGEVPVEAIAGRVENTGNPELGSRALAACSNAIPVSNRYSHFHHGQPNLLDHIMVSQSLLFRLKKAEIYNEHLHDESLPFFSDLKFPESDHAPFIA